MTPIDAQQRAAGARAGASGSEGAVEEGGKSDYGSTMEIYRRLYDLLEHHSRETRIRRLSIGLGYTAVLLDDGGLGIAYTWIENKASCSLFDEPQGYEGEASIGLLEKIFSDNLLDRSVALAVVNALNHTRCESFADDPGTLLDDLNINASSRVAMAGYFGPIASQIEARGAALDVYDIGKGVGSREGFYAGLHGRTDALIVSSTSIIHGSTEELLARIDRGIPAALLGPTTVMLPEAFSHLPITILAGTCPQEVDRVLAAVRHARGTRDIQRASRKVYWKKSS